MKDSICRREGCNDLIKKTSGKLYCSRTCAAIVNNRVAPKRKRGLSEASKCNRCGEYGQSWYRRNFCQSCLDLENFNAWQSSPISKYFIHGNARIKYGRIRTIARRAMSWYGVEKKCAICNFELVVDCCHIKPIHEFEPDTLLGVVNGRDNLIYLCPNHHKMLDKGYMSLIRHGPIV